MTPPPPAALYATPPADCEIGRISTLRQALLELAPELGPFQVAAEGARCGEAVVRVLRSTPELRGGASGCEVVVRPSPDGWALDPVGACKPAIRYLERSDLVEYFGIDWFPFDPAIVSERRWDLDIRRNWWGELSDSAAWVP